ncbi:hypothetical protein [Desulfuromonas sp. TF]|uniref:hypothetical protein n=1 Tax=Desulfuromonas sp. TF TaxID=1232410 RepID=UPI00041684B8|nr:hypothetical protein [Desulfuromonas sp. TF]
MLILAGGKNVPLMECMKWPSHFPARKPLGILLATFFGLAVAACAAISGPPPTGELPLLDLWSGDFPVKELARLPEGQQQSPTGFISDPATFAAVWRAFKPDTPLPAVDFDRSLVVFHRNTTFYNHTDIFKVEADQGVIDVLAMETMSALPIEDRVAMALAVIPRRGVVAIKAGDRLVPLR